ncbi:carbon-nitrogen hydrolase family protein [Metapseudomonas furukawaii]|uniref:Aliphatic amidase amiE n=1 Tax=Metapseudomonas furukawaii TaxID=1149133 RepID=A0AAD1C2U4_METFU|nr:carbon-nitrogen hydrolase family protein [Pseudomonas furukawaii]ELS29364.1 Aliphatic amidase amiE [Pseudomonas furukawaii]BAU75785.1 aliphatic amidase amiE [Pseudomonas furukawaii]
MKLELVQMAGRDGDTAYNLQRTLDAIAACSSDTDIVVFPESLITGFPNPQNIARLAEPLAGPSLDAIQQAAREHDLAVVCGLTENDQGRYYNTSVLVTPDGIALSYRKTHLWVGEGEAVLPGDRFSTVEWRGVRIGLLICYDCEFPETARALAELGAELLLITDGNMEPYGHVHRTAVAARAQENQVFAVMVNRVGQGDHGLTFAGGSMVANPFGRVLFEAGTEECRHGLCLDMTGIAAARALYDYHTDRRLNLPGERINHADGRRELLVPEGR